MHDAVLQWVSHVLDAPGRQIRSVVEIGGRDINGSIRSLFGLAETYTVIDLVDAPEVDYVGDAVELRRQGVLPAGVDCVVSTEALEHYPRPADVVDCASMLLRGGGVFIATMAGPGRSPHSGLIEGPPQPGEHYANVDPDALTVWLRAAGFARWAVDVAGLDVRCWAIR